VKAIGTMSGTSMDGVDVALIETDGERIPSLGPSGYRPYSDAERAILRQALIDARQLTQRDQRPGALAAAERVVTDAHSDAVKRFIAEHGIVSGDISAVAFHGQTVLHRPADRLTVQIGDGAALARSLALPVVSDLRGADVAAGGQGAPLVPAYHRALVRALDRDGPIMVVNIGGVGNITYVDGDTLIACDTGPGNALLDDFMLRMTGASVDRDGATAARGKVDEAWVAAVLRQPFFAKLPPKSLDRNDFAHLNLPTMSLEDGAATLTALTSASIARIATMVPRAPRSWIVVGGGANNPTMMRMLAERVRPARVERAADLGWQGDAIEAQAFGFLAIRSLMGLPLTFPTTTGVPAPLTGGVLAKP
jgi:anhydro-N-acetylmuramic acid kinase